MATATLVYTALATNLSPAALAAKLGVIHLDPNLVDPRLGDLTLTSDVTVPVFGLFAQRTIVYTLPPPPGPIFQQQDIGPLLTNYYTVTFSKRLASPVTAQPVVVA